MSKIALITGANRGLGLEAARQLAQQGFTIILGSRDLATLPPDGPTGGFFNESGPIAW